MYFMNDKNNSLKNTQRNIEQVNAAVRQVIQLSVLCWCSSALSDPLSAVEAQHNAENRSAASQAVTSRQAVEEMIVTARREPENALRLIGQVARVSAQTLNEVGHAHLQEVAVRIPGVWLSRGNGQEMLASVRSPVFTGAGSCGELLVAEDGLPIRPTGLCNVNQLFEVNTEQAAGFEVLRGPGSVFYGSNAVHGVINSLSPEFNRDYISLEHGPHQYWRTKVGVGGSIDNQRVWLAVNGASDGGAKESSGYDQQKLSLKHRLNAGILDQAGVSDSVEVETLFSWVNLNQETAGYIKGFESYEQADWEANANPEAYRDAKAMRFSTRVSGELSENQRWQVTPYARKSEMVFLQHYLPGQPEERNEQTSVGVQTSLQQALNESAVLWLGADMEWADMQVAEYQSETFISSSHSRYQGQHYDFGVRSQQWALYGNLAWQLSDRVETEFGLRWETLRYDYDNRMLGGSGQDDGSDCGGGDCRYFRAADRRDDFSNISGHAGITISLQDNLAVYGRVARAHRAPQINERYRLLEGQSVDEFEDKSIDSIELGARHHGDVFSAELSGYWMQKSDVVLKASNNATVGDGKTEHKGVELKGAYQFMDAWRFTTALAWAEHRVVSASDFSSGDNASGLSMDTAPQWVGSMQLRYQPSTAVFAEFEAAYMDRYYLDAANEHEYAGHTIYNALLGVSVNEQWQGRLRLQNITDERFAERADYAFGSYRYFTGEGRGLFAEVKRSF